MRRTMTSKLSNSCACQHYWLVKRAPRRSNGPSTRRWSATARIAAARAIYSGSYPALSSRFDRRRQRLRSTPSTSTSSSIILSEVRLRAIRIGYLARHRKGGHQRAVPRRYRAGVSQASVRRWTFLLSRLRRKLFGMDGACK
jgi:hypothetical protein